MRHEKRISSSAAMRMIVMVWLLLLAVTRLAAAQSVGAAIFIEGQASILRSAAPVIVRRSAEPSGLRKREWLFPGDRIESEEGARIVLTLFTKSRFDLEGATSLRIIESGVELAKGKVTSMIYPELLRDDELYEIRGPDTVARFRDTASMEVEAVLAADGVSRDTITTVCAGGAVRVSLLDGTTIGVDPGECARIVGNPPRVERTRLPVPAAAAPGPTLPKRHP